MRATVSDRGPATDSAFEWPRQGLSGGVLHATVVNVCDEGMPNGDEMRSGDEIAEWR